MTITTRIRFPETPITNEYITGVEAENEGKGFNDNPYELGTLENKEWKSGMCDRRYEKSCDAADQAGEW